MHTKHSIHGPWAHDSIWGGYPCHAVSAESCMKTNSVTASKAWPIPETLMGVAGSEEEAASPTRPPVSECRRGCAQPGLYDPRGLCRAGRGVQGEQDHLVLSLCVAQMSHHGLHTTCL